MSAHRSCPAAACRSRRRAGTGYAGMLAGILAIAAGAADAAALPERFDAQFVLSARGMDIGQTRWQLTPAGDGRYVYSSHSEAIGVAKLLRDERIEERSEWRFSRGGAVTPLHYTYTRSGGKRERAVQVRFDWQGGRVHNTLNGDSWSAPVEPGTLDKLVYVLELMRELANGAREATYEVADGGKVKTYRLKVVGEERVETVLGPLDTLVVERRRDDDNESTVVWCAPALRYLPVKVEHREDEGTVRLTLTGVDGLSP